MLFGSTKIVLYIDSGKVLVGDCRHDPIKFFEVAFQDDLHEVFDKIIEQLPSNSYKIILGPKISYTVKWEKIGDMQERTIVKEELTKFIPEDFDNDQFDWKIDKEDKIEAIVIVGNIYHQIQKIKTKNPHIRLETQSATSLFWELGKDENKTAVDANIFNYAANKGKEKGGDDMVLNVEVIGEDNVNEEIATPANNEQLSNQDTVVTSKKKSILISAFIFLIILLGGLGWYFLTRQPKQVAVAPVASETPTPTMIPVVEKLPGEFKILVQNGTSTVGLAGTYKAKLVETGFTQVETGNAESPSISTKVIVKEALPNSVQTTILEALKPLIPEVTINEVDTSTSSSDIVIILGTK